MDLQFKWLDLAVASASGASKTVEPVVPRGEPQGVVLVELHQGEEPRERLVVIAVSIFLDLDVQEMGSG